MHWRTPCENDYETEESEMSPWEERAHSSGVFKKQSSTILQIKNAKKLWFSWTQITKKTCITTLFGPSSTSDCILFSLKKKK